MYAKPDLRLSAPEQRRRDQGFLSRYAIHALAGCLPLLWPASKAVSPKHHYRSHYQAPDSSALLRWDHDAWATISEFDLILSLVDFSNLRPELAVVLYKASARGHVPFDPLSLFLLVGWQLANGWNRSETLRNLASSRYADYAAAFGFQPRCYPTESGLRHFLTMIGKQNLSTLIKHSMDMIKQAGLIVPEVASAAIVSFDGMLHDAASRLRCSATRETCYQAQSPEHHRPCPAQDKEQRGCACDTIACQLHCHNATPRDLEARYVWYSGSNRGNHPNAPSSSGNVSPVSPDPASAPPKSPKGEGHYGYRSLPAMLIDPAHRTTWVLAAADLAPANGHEDNSAAALLRKVAADYDWLRIRTAVGDAGLGYEPFLQAAYELHVRRVVDLRGDPRTDRDKAGWAMRGYDDKGRPICQFGYRLHHNGYDYERRRNKWRCHQCCETSTSTNSAAPPDCPYRDREQHLHGLIKNVGKTFADGSMRLVRDVPPGSVAWQEIYRRARNGAEGRNAALKRWDLKRLPVFGRPRAQATIFLADVWVNLTTVARLVKEATLAQLAQTGQAA